MNLKNIFAESGLLAKNFQDYSLRESQLHMAQAVAACLAEQSQLVVEAGTGTGKTFAYLVPALLSGKNIIISTGSKNLQDQLFYRDLPFISKLLGKSLLFFWLFTLPQLIEKAPN